ncbi:heterogeneous nuclear ribonucleoprotein U-like protein 1 [Melia azedarach]|uniref:Heterogeneous nuclear ribonucleoprotein U-like protein 1 n=1 Tax=Melia azedarach TaxID=155640 RepID=A0ACC1WY33_MELAZ|nr:heterogeneous nuclear ribonucleoprotein U-like protein 1 [Melia azedarach]
MSSSKRELPEGDEPELEPKAKKAKVDDATLDASGPSLQKQRVVLNPADCNLDFGIEDNGLQGSGLHQEGFAYCWSGARANVGITGGKYCFGCKVISTQPVDMKDTPPDHQHVCRVGILRGDDPVGNLGETDHSFGFGGVGKFSNAGKFLDFGEKFGAGDAVVCAVDLETSPLATIGFAKNGKWLGTAKQFDAGPKGLGLVDSPVRELQWESAVFPHILLKNVVVLMQFSIEGGLVPVEGYKPWVSAFDDGNTILGPTFCNMKDCEVMMMVGLPASGKTTWAEKWVKDNPEKRYVLLGTNMILEQMKVPGLLQKHNYSERFDCLMGRANAIFDTLLYRASRTPRNYIIDQTNVFKSARKRKLRPFASFHKIAVVVFPKPEELKIRSDKRFKEMGKEVPADAVNNMLANYVLSMSKNIPDSDEFFDKVMFVELDRGEAQRHLDELKRALGSASNPNIQSNYSPYSVGSEHWQSSYPPSQQLNYGYQMPNQALLIKLQWQDLHMENFLLICSILEEIRPLILGTTIDCCIDVLISL